MLSWVFGVIASLVLLKKEWGTQHCLDDTNCSVEGLMLA